MGPRQTVALIAHDARKEELVRFSLRHRPTLNRYRLIATASTGQLLNKALGSAVECKLSGSWGGDAQIAAEVASGLVRAVFFLVDPMSTHAHGADIAGLLRICNVHDVAVATNLSTAELMVCGLDRHWGKGIKAHASGRSGALEAAPRKRPHGAPPRVDA
jgi:methylglyoxal synthase